MRSRLFWILNRPMQAACRAQRDWANMYRGTRGGMQMGALIMWGFTRLLSTILFHICHWLAQPEQVD